MAKKERTITDVVRELMAQLPEVEEFVSHGAKLSRARESVCDVQHQSPR